jgi:antitoxin CptB
MTTCDTGLTDAEGLAREVAKLRWQCRRGMLELDLLLNRFLDTGYPRLDTQARIDFVRLLGYQDQIIYDWLMGQAVPADAMLRRLVSGIREAMRPKQGSE